jgi:hypothetical protein
MKREYTESFYEKMNKLVDTPHGYHCCRQCGATDGDFYRYGPKNPEKEGDPKGKTKAIVRLALIDPKGPPNDARNIGYYCTRCRKGPKENKRISKEERDKLPQLFEAKP